MRSGLIKTPSPHTIVIHTPTCSLMSEVILKLGFDIVVGKPGFDVGSHHVRRTGRTQCGGMSNQKARVLRREHPVMRPGRQAETKRELLPPRYRILAVNAGDHVAHSARPTKHLYHI